MDDTTAIGIMGLVLAMGAIFFLLLAAWYVVQIIAYWKIFTKAGEPGWKSIVPFYNAYIQFKLTWNPIMFFVMLGLFFVGFWLNGLDSAISILGYILLTASSIIGWIGSFKLAKAFGHGIGFTIGLILLQPIFILILGFGKDQYQGPQ